MSNLRSDCEELKNALDKFSTDDNAIINILAHRTNEYIQQLKETYKTMYNRELLEHIKSETSGNFEEIIEALFLPPIDYDCFSLNNAMEGLGTNEDTLIEILGSRSNEQLKEIIKRYKEIYNKSLEEEVISETSGDFKNALVALLKCNRSENEEPDETLCEAKAKELYDAGEGKRWGTDVEVFIRIFSTSSPKELQKIAKKYHKLTRRTIMECLNNTFSGDLKKTFKTIVYSLINPPEYFAKRLNDSMRGLGTRDAMLIRICVTRHEIDMDKIKIYYKRLYHTELSVDIRADTSGSYKKMLLELIS